MEAMTQEQQIDLAAQEHDASLFYEDKQVKGRVVTTMAAAHLQRGYGMKWPGYEVKQVIDGVRTYYNTFRDKLSAAEEYAWLRATARRNLHKYLNDAAPDTYSETH